MLSVDEIQLDVNDPGPRVRRPFFATLAEQLIHMGINLIVRPAHQSNINWAYINHWNEVAAESGLWVCLEGTEPSNATNYQRITL